MLGAGLNITSSAASAVFTSKSATFSNDYSLLLDGTGDYFDTNYSANDVFDGDFSASVWVRPTDGRSQNQMLWGAGTPTDYIYLAIDGLGRLVSFHVSNGDTAIVVSSVVFDDGEQSAWTHVVFSVVGGHGSDTTYQFYANGSAITTGLLLGSLVVSSGNHALFDSGDKSLYIGGHNANGSLSSPITGHIDEFSLHDETLSSDAVAAIYNDGVAINLTEASGDYDTPQRLSLYYRFENNANDEGSVGSNGSLAADALYSTAITPP